MNKKLISIALAATLTACGGSNSGSSGGNDQTRTGILTDAAIQGVQYLASPSGKTGTTTSTGQFTYLDGDRITLSFAGLTLPQVAAQERLTPLTLSEAIFADESASDINRAALNLAILFQALDSDGNPDNGIQLVQDVELPASITGNDLALLKDATPAAFADQLQNVLPGTLTVPSPIAAMEHFYKYELAGNWKQHSISTGSGAPVAYPGHNRYVLLDANGHFIRAEYSTSNAYLYTGYIEFDAEDLTLTTRPNERALKTGSSPGSITSEIKYRAFDLRVELTGNQLAFTRFDDNGDVENTYYYQRIPNEQGKPVGVWAELDTELNGTPGTRRTSNGMLDFGDEVIGLFSIFTDTHWVHLVLDRPEEGQSCEFNGVYATEYTYNTTTRTVTLDTDYIHNGIWDNPGACGKELPETIELRSSTRSSAERQLVYNGDTSESSYNLRNLSHEERLGEFSTPISNTPETPTTGLNLTGTWRITETMGANSCGESGSEINTYTVSQNGKAVTLTANGRNFVGSLNGNTLVWTGNYPEDGGTTSLNTTMTIAANGNNLTGSSNWTWTASVNEFCTGTTSYSGTRQ